MSRFMALAVLPASSVACGQSEVWPYWLAAVLAAVWLAGTLAVRFAPPFQARRGTITNHSSAGDGEAPETDRVLAVPLIAFFRVLAGLELCGGIVLCIFVWPGNPEPGYQWKSIAYIPSLTWLVAGIVSGSLFLAVAEVLRHLNGISAHLARIAGSGTLDAMATETHGISLEDRQESK